MESQLSQSAFFSAADSKIHVFAESISHLNAYR